MKKEWDVARREYEDIIRQLLHNRGIKDLDNKSVEEFLQPNYNTGLHDPYLLNGMGVAIDRLITAIEQKEVVGVFADYDADGVPGAALLHRTFNALGLKNHVYIPSREGGYGLSKRGIDYLIEKKCSLIFSVDLGIRNTKEAKYCQKKGVDLIILDHHLPGDEIPGALAVINPKIENSGYPFSDLCGCGVAYKLVEATGKRRPEIDEAFLKWNLDLVALSTIADMVPLKGENRVLTKFGLQVMRKSRNQGLVALCKAAKIEMTKIDPYIVGFQIGPRINTPGRIDHATKSYDLLVENNKEVAEESAEWLNVKNIERQQLMDQVFNQAVDQIENEGLHKEKIIIVSGLWQRGVLGPPASRLVEKYGRPVVVFAKEAEFYTGSARSVEGVHILDLLETVSKYLDKYGGHRGAAGLTVKKDQIAQFTKALTKQAMEKIDKKDLLKHIKIDAKIEPNEITQDNYKRIVRLEPFGQGNPRPVFLLEGVLLQNTRLVGNEGNHLSLNIQAGTMLFKSIYFNFASSGLSITTGAKYDIVFNITEDNWSGRNNLSLMINDMRYHD